MSKYYNDFINRYGIRSINTTGRGYDKFDTYSGTASFYNDREEMIDIEIPRRGFEEMVKVDSRYVELYDQEISEHYMRKKHPIIEEAYGKYKMLLELYR